MVEFFHWENQPDSLSRTKQTQVYPKQGRFGIPSIIIYLLLKEGGSSNQPFMINPWTTNRFFKPSIADWWFQPTPLKNDGVKVSWDDYSIPNWMEVIEFMFQTTKQLLFLFHRLNTQRVILVDSPFVD